MSREDEIVKAALDYANNLDGIKPTDEFSRNLCIALGQAFMKGALWQKEQMMAKTIKGIARPDDNEIWCDLSTFNFKDGDKCKVILIKED